MGCNCGKKKVASTQAKKVVKPQKTVNTQARLKRIIKRSAY